jgi:hypothetical protein
MYDDPDYVVVGHVTHDLQPDGSSLPGGTALYAAMTALRLGCRVGLATAGSPAIVWETLLPGAAVICQSAPTTTTFINRYHQGQRTQYLRQAAPAIELGRLPLGWRQAPIVHLGPVAQEVLPAASQQLRPDWLCATPQGWLRHWDEAGLVGLGSPPAAALAAVPLRVLVLSEGAEFEQSAALIEQVRGRGGLVAVTRGAAGSTLLWGAERCAIPTYRVSEVDPTGAGDVYAAALFIRLAAGDEPTSAAAYASAAGALSVTGPGTSAIADEAAIRRLMGRAC